MIKWILREKWLLLKYEDCNSLKTNHSQLFKRLYPQQLPTGSVAEKVLWGANRTGFWLRKRHLSSLQHSFVCISNICKIGISYLSPLRKKWVGCIYTSMFMFKWRQLLVLFDMPELWPRWDRKARRSSLSKAFVAVKWDP